MARRSKAGAFRPTPEQGEALIRWADTLIFRGELWRRSRVWRNWIVAVGTAALAAAQWGNDLVTELAKLLALLSGS